MKPTSIINSLFLALTTTILTHATPSFQPIRTGYGSNGIHSVIRDSIPHPGWSGHHVYLFRPDIDDGMRPVVFFCHGIGADDPQNYDALITHLVSTGFCVIYSPYRTSQAMIMPQPAYGKMWDGLSKGAQHWSGLIDTSRIGFVGHSYGGGAVPSHMRRAIIERGWGYNGAFMFIMAPWYCHHITQNELRYFPGHVKMIVQVYEDDRVNDHRMAADIVSSIGISPADKRLVTLHSDALGGAVLSADHGTPQDPVDALDYYGIYRLIDALADCAFTGSRHARSVAFGPESFEHRRMGAWSDGTPVTFLTSATALEHPLPQKCVVNFWGHSMNPRTKFGERMGFVARQIVNTPQTLWHYGRHAAWVAVRD